MADPVLDFDPSFGSRMDKLIAAAQAKGISGNFLSGRRTIEDQRQLYANMLAGRAGKPLPYPDRGGVRMAAVPGTSPHEKGVAADWSTGNAKTQAQVDALAPGLGLAIVPGDPGHYQLAKGISYGTQPNAASAPVAGALAARTAPEVGPENAGGPARAASEGPLDTRQLLYNKLTGVGLNPQQALGALYGLGGESATFDTGAYNPKDPGGSIGLAQWNGPRRAALEAFAKARGTAIGDPNTQADYLVDELTNTKSPTYQSGVLDAMKGAKDSAQATNLWVSKFERPLKNNWQQRYDAGASRVGNIDTKGNFALGTAPASNTSVASADAAPEVEKSWYGKLFDKGTDDKGNATDSPAQKMISAYLNSPQTMAAKEQQEAPPQSAAMQAPGSRNTSSFGGVGLAQPISVYGTTLNSLMAPLQWNDKPPPAPQMAQSGYQPQAPGFSLNGFGGPPVSPYGLGYGIDPNQAVGYGYG